jgi:hypothetical protein
MFIFDKLDRERDVLSHHFYSSALDDEIVRESLCASEVTLEAYLNIPQDDQRGTNRLDYESISATQQNQAALWNLPELNPVRYVRQQFGRTELVCYRSPGEHTFFIILPDGQVERTTKWYHQILQHAGMENLYSTMAKHYYHPGLKARLQRVIQSCEECQK